MKKFICTTQTNHITSYHGPSGMSYTSIKGHVFIVHDKRDIGFFQNKRQFAEVGLLKKAPKVELTKDEHTIFEEFLLGIAEVSKRTVKKLIKKFELKDNLIEHLETGGKLPKEVPKKQASAIMAGVLNKGDE